MMNVQADDQGLVPLAVASRLAYRVLAGTRSRAASEEELAALVPGVALALSSIATIFYLASRDTLPLPLSRVAIEQIFSGGNRPWSGAGLNLYIRRDDLYLAIAALKSASPATLFSRSAAPAKPAGAPLRPGTS